MMNELRRIKASDHFVRILLIGSSGVGKTSLLLRYVDDTFLEEVPATIGIECEVKTVHLEDKVVKLQIWDTADQELFTTVTSSYYKVDGVMVIYSSVDKESFLQTEMWFREIERYAPEGVCRLLVGNMCDCADPVVDEATAKACTDRMGAPFIETSAKDNINVDEAFVSLLHRILTDPTSSYNMKTNRVPENSTRVSACCVLQ